MKQLAIIMAMLVSALMSNAQLRFKMIETTDSTTTFVFTDTKMGKEAKATSAYLYNDGKCAPPLSIISKYENCVNTYSITFPLQTVLNKTSVTLMINGGKHTENIWEQITDAAIRRYPHINVNGSRVLIINNGK